MDATTKETYELIDTANDDVIDIADMDSVDAARANEDLARQHSSQRWSLVA